MNSKVIVVTGPTGIGKTDFVLKLAAQFPSEIINADMGQMYTPLTIGTAKPDWKNEPVPHHLFDILDLPTNFSMVQFRQKVGELVPQIWARGKTAIIVGGSTMYIKSLFYAPAPQVEIANSSNQVMPSQALASDLWAQLNVVDPLRAAQLHPNDTYRLQRAWQIWQSGQQPSSCQPHYDPLFENTVLYVINGPKTILYERINQRVHAMMQAGWLAEVEQLSHEWRAFLRRKKIIGYEVILDYFDQKIPDLALCIATIQQRVRRYAKKQQTFWRGLQKELLEHEDMHKRIFELDLTLLNVDLYLDQLYKS